MKKNKFSVKFIVSVILLFIALIYSCDSSITNPPIEIGTKDFPNKIGNEWTYFYYDSLSNSADTVVVSIIGDTTFSGSRKAKIWQYKFRDNIEFRFVEILNDTVRIYDNLIQRWVNTKFVFPIKKNKRWNGDFLNDTSSVVNMTSINVFAGHFEDSYLIKEGWGALNDYGIIYSWFVPGVGIVKKHHLGWSFGNANNYWELMEYKIE